MIFFKKKLKKEFKNDKFNIFLLGSVLFLFLFFVLSFVFSDKSISKKMQVTSSLMNPKYKQSIDYLELSSGQEKLELIKKNGIWFAGESSEANGMGDFFIPCRKEKIQDFLDQLTSPRPLEKIAVKINELSDFGLALENQFLISYYGDSGSLGISFGDSNFSDTGRYVKSSGKNDVYLTDKSFDKYLYVSLNQWTDPYLISRSLGKEYKVSDLMTKGFEEIFELRHGGISYFIPGENDTPLKKLKLEMGDTSSFVFTFYRKPDQNDFHVSIEYENPLGKNKENIKYSVKISEWTYNKIFSD